MSQVTDPVILDSTGQIIVSKLQDIIDAINGGTIDPLSVTRNGTYTPSGTTLGYGPVTVDVPLTSGTIIFGTAPPASNVGNDGDTYVQYHAGLPVTVNVTGGYNGGAVISVLFLGTQVFTATGDHPYNLVYDHIQAEILTDIGTVNILVTPPLDQYGNLYITVTGPNNAVTSNPQKAGSNTSYGYSDYTNSFYLDGSEVWIAESLFIKQSGTWRGVGDRVLSA